MKNKTQIAIVIFASAAILFGLICYIVFESPVTQPAFEASFLTASPTDTYSENAASSKSDEKININTAEREALMQLHGIGEVLADRIISYREQNGPFENISQIKEVSGIGDKLFQEIAYKITVE